MCFPGLTHLDLSHNELEVLPDGVYRLRALLVFDVSFNKLKNVDKFNNLVSVMTLKASNNNIENFPMLITELENLEILDLSNNKIPDMPSEFGRLRFLKDLNLSHNLLTQFPNDKMELLASLDTLNISHNRI